MKKKGLKFNFSHFFILKLIYNQVMVDENIKKKIYVLRKDHPILCNVELQELKKKKLKKYVS